jgi:mannose-6-phosphate isomerase-like protein (cupin superfamily)
VIDALFPEGRRAESIDALLDSLPLPADADFRVEEGGRDAHTSHHLVWIRRAEVPHRHDRHDLWVVMLRGHGGWRLGNDERPVGPGSVLYVPRGTVHAFRNASTGPAAAYAVYTPPFDGKDRVDSK